MIGTQPTGAIDGVVISAVAHEGLTITVDGKPGRLAIVDETGQVVTASPLVAREVESVVLNMHRNFWQAQGWMRVYSKPFVGVDVHPLSKACGDTGTGSEEQDHNGRGT